MKKINLNVTIQNIISLASEVGVEVAFYSWTRCTKLKDLPKKSIEDVSEYILDLEGGYGFTKKQMKKFFI